MAQPSISVVIPTLNAGAEIDGLLDILMRQTTGAPEILVVDSSSDDDTAARVSSHPGVTLKVIRREEFNHGTTRHQALLQTSGDIVCFLTQDAVPVGDSYLEKLTAPIVSNDRVALASGRQLPKADARRFEQLVREFNYPEESNVRGIDDLERYGIKAFLASDVCSAYRREAYLACGGFPKVNTNEDMLMASRLIRAGWLVAYASDACVYHSHNFTFRQQYRRNREVGMFLEEYRSEFGGSSEMSQGKRLVKHVSSQLAKEHRFGELCSFGLDCFARLLGNKAGHREFRNR
jgi:rhamnosyltransferase